MWDLSSESEPVFSFIMKFYFPGLGECSLQLFFFFFFFFLHLGECWSMLGSFKFGLPKDVEILLCILRFPNISCRESNKLHFPVSHFTRVYTCDLGYAKLTFFWETQI